MNTEDIKPGGIYRGTSGRIRRVALIEQPGPQNRDILSHELKFPFGESRSAIKGKGAWWKLQRFADWAVEEFKPS